MPAVFEKLGDPVAVREPRAALFGAQVAFRPSGVVGGIDCGPAPSSHHRGSARAPRMGPSTGEVVLLVSNETTARERLSVALRRAGYRLLETDEASAARALIGSQQPALVVLDALRSEANGFELCRWIRTHSELPVIMLMAPGDHDGRMIGFELGADDCVARPYSPREVAARVSAVLRRTVRSGSVRRIQAGPLLIDGGTREVTREGRSLKLTTREFDLLWFLAGHPRLVFSRRQLMDRVWGCEAAFDTSTVTVHVRRLREKIEGDPSRPRHVQTIRGAGYRFVA